MTLQASYPVVGDLITVKRFFEVISEPFYLAEGEWDIYMYPGDVLKVVKSRSMHPGKIWVCHPHSTTAFSTEYRNFLPLGPREFCECVGQQCGCIYENFEASRKHQLNKHLPLSPESIPGQKSGAHLKVKRIPWQGNNAALDDLKVEVDDIVMIQPDPSDSIPGKFYAFHMRTKKNGYLLWKAVYPVGPRERCNCRAEKLQCRCEYENFDASMAYFSNKA